MHRMFVILFGLALAAATPAAASVTLVMVTGFDGTRYAISPGTDTGTCSPIPDGLECVDGPNRASATSTAGCGAVSGSGFCIVVPEGLDPVVVRGATTTLSCPDSRKYEVSDGANGSCTVHNNNTDQGEATCSDQGLDNFAKASCKEGCGDSSGSGSCTMK